MATENPYKTPLEAVGDSGHDAVPATAISEIARTTFLSWEKLRVLYVAVLTILTVGFIVGGAPKLLTSTSFWSLVIPGAVGANLCFFAGPAIETYVSWLGYRRRWVRIVLFVSGTLFASLLTIGVLWQEAW